MPALVVYGLPCTGKTSLIKNLDNYQHIGVDSIIKLKNKNPDISDFLTFSDQIMQDILTIVTNSDNSDIVIEMGCLTPKKGILHLESGLKKMQCVFSNIVLTDDHDELITRIKKRNANIDKGKSNSIKIDGPDFLTRFTRLFDNNQPDNAIYVDTSNKTNTDVLSIVKSINKLSI
jgi:broad-specificity NMP kinase